MATQTVTQPEPKPATPQAKPIPIKVGVFGGQGSGKSTSTALMAVALSKEYYGGAPVYVTDTEPGWQFLKRRIFDVEQVDMIQRTEPTFKAMVANLREAEKMGCCVWTVDSLTIIWNELMQSFKARLGYIPIDKWGDIKQMWGDYTNLFLNSKMSCFALGRLGNDMEEVQDEAHEGKTKLVKVGTKLKAGGGESFGYEPHLLLELSLERKAKVVAGSRREGEGRMVHRVDVLKDRTWSLNGKTLRWSDKPNYVKGGYRTVWESIKPHFDEVQMTMGHVAIQTGTSSQSLIDNEGNSEYYRNKKRRDVLTAELHATMELLWGGTAKEAKEIRMKVFEHIFGFRSKEAADNASLETIERGVRILQSFEKRTKREIGIIGGTLANLLAHLDIEIQEYEQGVAEVQELPF
jgi:hypothetical protein